MLEKPYASSKRSEEPDSPDKSLTRSNDRKEVIRNGQTARFQAWRQRTLRSLRGSCKHIALSGRRFHAQTGSGKFTGKDEQ